MSWEHLVMVELPQQDKRNFEDKKILSQWRKQCSSVATKQTAWSKSTLTDTSLVSPCRRHGGTAPVRPPGHPQAGLHRLHAHRQTDHEEVRPVATRPRSLSSRPLPSNLMPALQPCAPTAVPSATWKRFPWSWAESRPSSSSVTVTWTRLCAWWDTVTHLEGSSYRFCCVFGEKLLHVFSKYSQIICFDCDPSLQQFDSTIH